MTDSTLWVAHQQARRRSLGPSNGHSQLLASVIFNLDKLPNFAQVEQILFSAFGPMEALSTCYTNSKDLLAEVLFSNPKTCELVITTGFSHNNKCIGPLFKALQSHDKVAHLKIYCTPFGTFRGEATVLLNVSAVDNLTPLTRKLQLSGSLMGEIVLRAKDIPPICCYCQKEGYNLSAYTCHRPWVVCCSDCEETGHSSNNPSCAAVQAKVNQADSTITSSPKIIEVIVSTPLRNHPTPTPPTTFKTEGAELDAYLAESTAQAIVKDTKMGDNTPSPHVIPDASAPIVVAQGNYQGIKDEFSGGTNVKNVLIGLAMIKGLHSLVHNPSSPKHLLIRHLRSLHPPLSLLALQETHISPEHQSQIQLMFQGHNSLWTPHCGLVSLTPTLILSQIHVTDDDHVLVIKEISMQIFTTAIEYQLNDLTSLTPTVTVSSLSPDITFVNPSWTDHSLLAVIIPFSRPSGPRIWHFNSNYLLHDEFEAQLVDLLADAPTMLPSHCSPGHC
ncbi:hypothetical protein PHYBLDRAFT_148652 [Phycomyces blakesleeanus NRRL 1555(-)]|uniref:Endonuclease/exonuclease/phosphatase domain-containing protein n=1 Tax=Phycomyces blakesleeanus (strain ATCC 8743b / DSM 1359 / FGSC 10004 / NBRC 33097 / NRRL 1555) TaxID=763407 RepID=A0A163DB35_PHYB8|nr:hypothetical protein PHYBLDRAFT_148652 [Phycomyces blakesleeanus NRRL 1555(-)]OAD70090.1 hypothetical protein PHYBLDRAFT_148652 [Phycomyces blakesleeanus NRRL 1555(-)]|eukprot:XP_018288130.1 hypothetical protein PHYBLDRAFT_148652 [Phycomyces blakesleeanus NRRL 1555(-)]